MSYEMDTIAEVGHTVFIKKEFIESDLLSAHENASTDLATQPVKSENTSPSCDEVGSPEQCQTNLFSAPVNELTRIKTEESLEESNSVDPSDIRTRIKLEVPDHLFVREKNGREYNAEGSICIVVNPLLTTKGSEKNKNDKIHDEYNGEIPKSELVTVGAASPGQLPGDSVSSWINSLIQIKPDVHDEEHKLVKALHTDIDIKNEECSSEYNYEDGINIPANFSSTVLTVGGINYIPLVHNSLKNDVEGINTSTEENHDQNLKPFSCSVCSISFYFNYLLTKHMKRHSGERPFICNDCSASFHDKGNLKRHMRKHTGEKPYSCCHCSASFSQKHTLTAHNFKHTGGKPFKCSHCSASFTQKPHLKSHMRKHTGEKPYSCSDCSASFSHKNSLVCHIRKHTGEKPFLCSYCSASFATRSNLYSHMRYHTGEEPFSCSHCSASFNLKSNLKAHMRLHTGERPFSCPHCRASFIRKDDLNQHMFKHTGQKPYICSNCSASFGKKHSLKAHVRKHTGEKPFSCSYCPAAYSRKEVLNLHILEHIGQRPYYVCSHCSASFSHKSSLKTHMRKHTG